VASENDVVGFKDTGRNGAEKDTRKEATFNAGLEDSAV